MYRRYAPILGPALLSLLIVCCTRAGAEEKTTTAPLTDISILGPASDAIIRIVNQGIMTPLSPGVFGPLDNTTRRQFVVAVQRLFHLTPAQNQPLFHDVPSTDPDLGAINSVAPFMQRQAFCPGCALNNEFRPEAPISVTAEAVTLTSILNSRHQIELTNASDAASMLAPASDLSQLAAPAQVFVATAVRNGIVSIDDLMARNAAPIATRAATAVLLDTIQQRFKIPNLPQP